MSWVGPTPKAAVRLSARCCSAITIRTGGGFTPAGFDTGIRADQLSDLLRRLQPLQIDRMPLDVAPPRSTRFGSPLVLSRVQWVRPEVVVEVKYLTWTDDGLLRQVVYEGIREDKPARAVVRQQPPP